MLMVSQWADNNTKSKEGGRGYFDSGLDEWRKKMADRTPAFNGEFSNIGNTSKRLIVWEPNPTETSPSTYRGQVQFSFIGPMKKQNEDLANLYQGTRPTAGVKGVTSKKAKESKDAPAAEGLYTNLTSNPKNDASKKNLSSIVFNMRGTTVTMHDEKKDVSALFMGDASAATIFGSGFWDGQIMEYDVLKVPHHGSCYNNHFGLDAIEKIKSHQKDQGFYPGSAGWKKALLPRLADGSKESKSLENVLAFFGNVRAQKYIISGAQDMHENPHVSTLIGIIARAIMFPTPNQPVLIYLTNPIRKETWRVLVGFWLGVSNLDFEHVPAKKTSATAIFDQQLQQMRTEASAQTIIKDLLYDAKGEQYQFLQLRPHKSHGLLDLGTNVFAWADWVKVCPFDSWNDLTAMNSEFYKGDFMADIHEEIVNLAANKKKLDVKTGKGVQYKLKENFFNNHGVTEIWEEKTQKKVKTFNDGTQTQNQADLVHLNYMRRAPSPQFSYQVALDDQSVSFHRASSSQFNNLVARHLNADFKAAESSTFMETPAAEVSADEDLATDVFTGGAMATEVSTEETLAAGASAEDASAIGAPSAGDTVDINPSNAKAADSAAASPGPGAGPHKTALPAPGPLQPDWKAFRRFGVDMMEIPLGDTFGKEMKLKVLSSLYDLMNHLLLLEDSFTVKPGAKASADGSLPPLGAMLNFLLGAEGASHVLKVLPINSTARGLPSELVSNIGGSMLPGAGVSPLFWSVSRLRAIVMDVESMGYGIQGSTGIHEVMMHMTSPAGDTTTWVVPNPAQLLGNGTMNINVHQGIDLTIYWPCNPRRRIVYGYFQGSVPVGIGKPEHKVICDFLMLPDPDTSVQYHIQFADDNYEIANHAMPFTELLAALDGAAVNLATAATKALFPELDIGTLNNAIRLSEPGFVLARGSLFGPQLQLYRIFGTIESGNKNNWQPFKDLKTNNDVGVGMASFLESVSISMPRVQLTVQDPFTGRGPKLFFHVYHALTVSNVHLEYEIASVEGITGSTAYQLSLTPSSAAINQPLTITGLFQALALSTIDPADLPDLLHSLLDSVGIRSFRLGWNGGEFHGKPDFIDICLQISDLKIVGDTLGIEDVLLRIRVDWPSGAQKAGSSSNADKNVYVQAIGTIQVVDHDVAALFTYGTPPFMLADGYLPSGVSLDLQLLDSPLSLGDVLGHFFPGQTAVPEPFEAVVKEVGLSRLRLQTDKTTDGKQVITLVEVGLGLKKQRIQLLDDLVLGFPQLSLTSFLPPEPDAKKREFAVEFDAMVEMSGHTVLVNVSAVTGAQAQFGIILTPGGAGFPVSAFVEFCAKHLNQELHLDLPEKFDSLRQCYLNGFSLIVGKDPAQNNQWKLQNIGFAASSDIVLELWDQPKVALERVATAAKYQQPQGFEFTFNAILNIGSCTLDTVVQYGHLSSLLPGPTGAAPQPATSTPQDGTQKGWLVEAIYDGDISLFEIVQKLTGLDVKGNLESTNLERLKVSNELTISKPSLSIRKEGNGGSISVSFDSDWSVFKHFDFAATLQKSAWGFCIAMEVENDLLHLLPDSLQVLGDYLKVDNTNVAFQMGKVNTKEAGIVKDLPVKRALRGPSVASQTNFGLAVKTNLSLGSALGAINGWASKRTSIDVDGQISSDGFQLGVEIGAFNWPADKAYDPTFALDADIFVGSSKANGFHVGIAAHMKIHLPSITKSLIDIPDAYFMLDTNTKSLALGLTTDGPLEDLFGITGFKAKNLTFNMSFSEADPLIPNALGMAGDLSLASAAGAHGNQLIMAIAYSIDFYFSLTDASNCYLSGLLENIEVAVILDTLLQQHSLPAVAKDILHGNLKINKLGLEMASREIHNEKRNTTIQPGFLFAADVELDICSWSWSGFIHVEFHTNGKFSFILMMSPINFGIGSTNFFSLARADPPDGLKDLKFARGPASAGQQDLPEPSNRFDGGPVIYIVPEDSQNPLFVSNHAKLLGFDIATRLVGTKDSFNGQLTAQVSDLVKLDVHAELKLNEQVHINGSLSLHVDLVTVPNLILNAIGIQAQIPGMPWTNINASLTVDLLVSWPKEQTTHFTLSLKGSLGALGQTWNFPELKVIDASISDFDDIGRITKKVGEWFVGNAKGIITDGLKALHIDEAARFLKDKLEMAEQEVVKAVQVITEDPDVQNALTVKDALNLTGETVANLVKTLFSSAPPEEQLKTLLNIVPRETLLSVDGMADKVRGLFGNVVDDIFSPNLGSGTFPRFPLAGGSLVDQGSFKPIPGIIDVIGGSSWTIVGAGPGLIEAGGGPMGPGAREARIIALKQEIEAYRDKMEQLRRAGIAISPQLAEVYDSRVRELKAYEQQEVAIVVGIDLRERDAHVAALNQETDAIHAKIISQKQAGVPVDPQLLQMLEDRKGQLTNYYQSQQGVAIGGVFDPQGLQVRVDALKQETDTMKAKAMAIQAAGGQPDPQLQQMYTDRRRKLEDLLAQEGKMTVSGLSGFSSGFIPVAQPAMGDFAAAENVGYAFRQQAAPAGHIATQQAEQPAYAVAQPTEQPAYALEVPQIEPALAGQDATVTTAPTDETPSMSLVDLLLGGAVGTDLSPAEAAARAAALVPPDEHLPPQGLTLAANLVTLVPLTSGHLSMPAPAPTFPRIAAEPRNSYQIATRATCSMETAPEPVISSQRVAEFVALSQTPAESVVPIPMAAAESVSVGAAVAPPAVTAESQSHLEAERSVRASLNEVDSIGLLRDLRKGGWSVDKTWQGVTGLFGATNADQVKSLMIAAGWTEIDLHGL